MQGSQCVFFYATHSIIIRVQLTMWYKLPYLMQSDLSLREFNFQLNLSVSTAQYQYHMHAIYNGHLLPRRDYDAIIIVHRSRPRACRKRTCRSSYKPYAHKYDVVSNANACTHGVLIGLPRYLKCIILKCICK